MATVPQHQFLIILLLITLRAYLSYTHHHHHRHRHHYYHHHHYKPFKDLACNGGNFPGNGVVDRINEDNKGGGCNSDVSGVRGNCVYAEAW